MLSNCLAEKIRKEHVEEEGWGHHQPWAEGIKTFGFSGAGIAGFWVALLFFLIPNNPGLMQLKKRGQDNGVVS